MRIFTLKRTLLAAALAWPFLLCATVSAHVAVRPAEALTASFQTFTVSVPNEKDTPVTSIKLLIPTGLDHVSPTVKPGWQITAAEADITWSGGSIAAGLRDDFSFSAKLPARSGQLAWKAYQTYADGTTVAWDQTPKAIPTDDDSAANGPFSVTKIVNQTEADSTLATAEKVGIDAKATANRAFYFAIITLAIACIALSFATRKK
jgi:uncharacterized protein YcnI